MLRTRFIASIFLMGLMALGAGMTSGQTTSTGSRQDYPNKPIRIVTATFGSGSDVATRLIAHALPSSLGQQVIVDNRSTGVIPGQIVAQAQPDGYTLLVIGGSFWLGPLSQKTPYDPIKDFSPISLFVRSPNILVVHPSLPVKSVRELIALAKAKPGELNYASTGTGGSFYLAAELFKSMANVNIVDIPYKGTVAGLNDLIGGRVQLSFPSTTSGMPFVKAGRLKGLAVTSAQPSMLVPDLPTVAASGLPGYEAVSSIGIFAPARTPVNLISRLNQEIVAILNRAEIKEKFLSIGSEAAPSSPEQLATAIKSEMLRMGKVIKDAGIRKE